MHKKSENDLYSHIREVDAVYHSELIKELGIKTTGEKFRGFCGENYHGDIPGSYEYYWRHILNAIPENTAITWTGPKVRCRSIKCSDIPDINHPILLFDNHYSSDSKTPDDLPIYYPYNGRSPDLKKHIDTVVDD